MVHIDCTALKVLSTVQVQVSTDVETSRNFQEGSVWSVFSILVAAYKQLIYYTTVKI